MEIPLARTESNAKIDIVKIEMATNVSTKVNPRFYRGDFNGAKTAAEEAARWTKISFWIGITIFVLKFISIVSSGSR